MSKKTLLIDGSPIGFLSGSGGGGIRYDEENDVVQLYYDGQWVDWKSGGMAYPVGTELIFEYTGGIQPLEIPATGTWKLEVYGAAGGAGYNSSNSAKGGYAVGKTTLYYGDMLYIVVGGKGANATLDGTNNGGGYNGGGNAYYAAGCGGGATHISTTETILVNTTPSNVLIVGGGAGGGGYGTLGGAVSGGTGGGLTGGSGSAASGNTGTGSGASGGGQTSGGAGRVNGSFGQGAHSNAKCGPGGGGGWYGGGSGYVDGGYDAGGGGGGGSSYIGQLTDASTIAGQRSGNGYAKLTFIGR